MPAPEFRFKNRVVYFRKSIRSPDFGSERVLARDAFQFAELWLNRKCKAALPYWTQARSYFSASKELPAQSSPLTSYYCFLNAAKALLIVKGFPFSEHHGVAGEFDPSAKRALVNEKIRLKASGVLAALSKYLGEEESEDEHSLTDVLSNLVFIHRAYRYTFRSHPELFIPVRNVLYRKHPADSRVWVSADIEGRFADGRSLRTLPIRFEVDAGYTDRCVVRTRKRVKWYGRNCSKEEQERARTRLATYHKRLRTDLVYISALPVLWYIKRSVAEAKRLNRYGLTLIMAAMHRLSELSRYDPNGLNSYLEGRESWLLTEFIELAPAQFMDELVCEMTCLEFGLPGIRPRST